MLSLVEETYCCYLKSQTEIRTTPKDKNTVVTIGASLINK